MAFPAIATQFIFIKQLKVSPVGMAFAYSLVSVPWTLKPIYGFITDRYAVFDWGKRRPYVFYAGILLSYVYIVLGKVIHEFYLLLASLIFISFLLCFADVATDSITVELVKMVETPENEGIIQSNNWIGRALGTVSGAFFGGMAFAKLDAETVYKLCGIFPFLMACVVWDLPKSEHAHEDVFSKLWKNFKEQKELAIILLLISISPNYGTFYTYFLTDKLNYTPSDFTWLSMTSSLSFLAGVVSFRLFFRTFHIKRTLQTAVIISVIFRLPQLLVVTGYYQEFWLVLCDGIVESFSFQLIIMPLIVYTAKRCNDGCEGSLFALMMSISNLSGIMGDQLGAAVAGYLNVTEKNFDNLKWLMVIAILGDLIIPMLAILRMFSSSSETYSQLDHTPELQMISLKENTSETSVNKQDSSGNQDDTPGSLAEQMDRTRDFLAHHKARLDHIQGSSEPRYSDHKYPGHRRMDQLVKEAVDHYETARQEHDELTSEEAELLKRVEETCSDEIEVDLELDSEAI